MTDELAQKFVAAFRKGIETEKDTLRADSTAYEVPLERGQQLTEMTQPLARGGNQYFYSFSLPRPSDRLSPGVQCNLREPSGLEVAVTLMQVEEQRLTLRSEVLVSLAEGAYRLVFVPWFLYDSMQSALDEVAFPATALRTFGKLPSARTPGAPVSLQEELNCTQRAAVQQAVESQLTILWGPPGTGKTTTLAELVANLAGQGKRILIASTTHAAIDQVLERLVQSAVLAPLLETGKVIRLGFSGGETFGCSLSEVVGWTQAGARRRLGRSLARQEQIRHSLSLLKPALERCARAAGESQQLDLFAEQLNNLTEDELAVALPLQRAAPLAGQTALAQHAVLARLGRRLEALERGLQTRIRSDRLALANGQQEAVDQARIILSTLANTYVSPLLKGQEFEAAVLEEAGMAILPALYLAAGRASEQVILVGDPQQLPAILASRDPFAEQALGRNIFDVLGERPEKIMLDMQYRMHPHIGDLVSQLFYGGGLRHAAGPQVELVAARPPFPGQAVVVIDRSGPGCSVDAGDYSRFNLTSALMAADLAAQAAAQGSSVAIITPYRKQVRKIQDLLEQRGLSQEQVHCATVHRFQGNERDVVILDVVDGPPMEPGTLLCGRGPRAASANLLNVSLSRARGKLILIADLHYVRSRAAGGILHQVLEAAQQLSYLTTRYLSR